MPQSAGRQPGDLKFRVRWVLRERASVLADEWRVRSRDQSWTMLNIDASSRS